VRVAVGVVRRDERAAELVGVRVVKEATEVVLRDAPLPQLGDDLGMPRAAVVSDALVVVGAVDPVVQARHQAVGHVLRVAADAVVVRDDGLLIGLPVAVGVTAK
jgi:hypothetical protein